MRLFRRFCSERRMDIAVGFWWYLSVKPSKLCDFFIPATTQVRGESHWVPAFAGMTTALVSGCINIAEDMELRKVNAINLRATLHTLRLSG